MNQAQRRLFLIQSLLKEKTEYRDTAIPAEPESQRQLLRGLMNIRAPQSIGADFLQTQDAYLQGETAAKGITDVADLTPVQPGLYLWQGDITTLKCDAIVNAANSGMTGCYIPNHRCIDNAIHTFAGVELRLACAELMEQQGHPGTHRTGENHPGVQSALPLCAAHGRPDHQRASDQRGQRTAGFLLPLLSWSWRQRTSLESVAFCCISTGEFHFPNDLAAEIAVADGQRISQKANQCARR